MKTKRRQQRYDPLILGKKRHALPVSEDFRAITALTKRITEIEAEQAQRTQRSLALKKALEVDPDNLVLQRRFFKNAAARREAADELELLKSLRSEREESYMAYLARQSAKGTVEDVVGT